MKKVKLIRIILVVSFFLIQFPVLSQTHLIGFQGGIAQTNIKSEEISDNKSNKSGFEGGITYNYYYDRKLQFGVDLLYQQKGFKSGLVFTDYNGYFVQDDVQSRYNYNYFSLPIKLCFNSGNKLSGIFCFGFVPSALISSKITRHLTSNKERYKINVTDRITRYDLALLFEIGALYQIDDKTILFATVNYQRSIIEISGSEYYNNEPTLHYGWTISIGVKKKLNQE